MVLCRVAGKEVTLLFKGGPQRHSLVGDVQFPLHPMFFSGKYISTQSFVKKNYTEPEIDGTELDKEI